LNAYFGEDLNTINITPEEIGQLSKRIKILIGEDDTESVIFFKCD